MDFLNQGIEQTATIPPPGANGISDFLFNPAEVDENMPSAFNRRAVRWIVMAGDDLPPNFKRVVKEMRMGGENLGSSLMTLKRASNGFLRRCQLTPLTLGSDVVPVNKDDDDVSKYKSRTGKVYNHVTEAYNSRVVYYNECLPGDELQSLLQGQEAGNGINDKGIREVEALFDERAVEPGSKEFNEALKKGLDYQYKIFPDWADYLNGKKEFFPHTSDLAAYLIERRDALASDYTATAIIDVLLESNAQFERYATDSLSRMKDTIEAGKQEGKIYSWGDKQVGFFEMLQLNREQFLMKRADPVPVQAGVSPEAFAEQARKLDTLTDSVTMLVQATGNLAGAFAQPQPSAAYQGAGAAPEIAVSNTTATGAHLAAQVCADKNSRGEDCKSPVNKEIDGKFYCKNHPLNRE